MSFPFLVVMRIVAGLVAGGVFPIAMALVGDLVAVERRQVAIARILGVALTGNVLGSSFAGVIGDMLGWRGVFGILGPFGLVIAIAAFFAFRGAAPAPARRFDRTEVLANFRGIFADPRAKVCFSSVFFEAIFIHGLFPYVALLLLAIGEPRASIAGLLIAYFAVGGVLYSLVVPMLLGRVRERWLMVAGGTLSACGLTLIALQPPWVWQIVIFTLFGFGFYLLPGPRYRPVADGARRRRLAPFLLVLSRPGGGTGCVRLRLCPFRRHAEHPRRGRGAVHHRAHLLAALAAAAVATGERAERPSAHVPSHAVMAGSIAAMTWERLRSTNIQRAACNTRSLRRDAEIANDRAPFLGVAARQRRELRRRRRRNLNRDLRHPVLDVGQE